MMEIPMPIKLNAGIDSFVEITTPIGAGKLSMKGFADKDNDKNPEVQFHLDMPGEKLDLSWEVEIPVSLLLGGSIWQIAEQGLTFGPDFPGKSIVISFVATTIEAIGNLLGAN